ncbi:substrate-binding periplasmic protein [Aliamphritea spongicola]|uniref:substrate-binding periplasmic protein n=1 Tax=Aliamphritea spongicola TaxID=707589 RepID=UPI00196B5B74|nr:transporter substrate-binding domain-containing protein [Aliamphritea spongicola]MBN3561466.1 transporter substrate-binding domain-containing protein [Aliamphritea spongicola]
MRKCFIFGWCIPLVLFLISGFVRASDTLPLASGDWPPYTQNVPGDYGLTTEIVSAVIAEMGMHTEVQWLPWKRNEVLLRQGKVFAAFPYRKTLERSSEFAFSDPLIFTTTRLFFDAERTEPVTFEKFSDLKGVLIGGVRGYSYVGDFESVGAELTVVNSDVQLVKMLASQRIDFAALDTLGGRLLLADMLGDRQADYRMLPKPLYSKSPSRLMVSRNYPGHQRLLSDFNGALLRIKEQGIYQKILQKYQFVEE